ncbi:MAG TPA: aspartate aminotransferase family protein [Fimbriimonadaceae bacterium]|nr:aspartate aminotransferase family protein [Fimbriimonadaceae bacterium]HRE94309.1 aspartate aminotransferase family protein [Fimbriimonadaceae bacterium]
MAMNADALRASVVSDYSEHLNPGLAKLMQFAGFGVEVSAEGMYITDQDGRQYLDFLGGYGVFSLGHRHPDVLKAVVDQLQRQPLSSKTFFNPVQGALARRLAEVAPEGLQYTFFSNSGTEAVEAALKMARAATGRTGFVSTEGGYHGKTLGALSVTGREKYRKPYQPLVPGASFVPYGDLAAAEAAINETTAAFIVETVQGEGGVHVAPPGYLAGLRAACDRAGALLIADEVQTGLGRTGKWFGCDHEQVRPDLMTLAKALGGGVMPIGATMGTAAVWNKVFADNPLTHTSTFGGNPLACAAGLAVLDIMERDNLVERVATQGDRLQAALKEAFRDQPLVAEVRGQGLLIGVEFAEDEVGELVIAQMMKRGVIAAYTLNNPRVIRMEPPFLVTDEQIDHAVNCLKESVTETADLISAFA